MIWEISFYSNGQIKYVEHHAAWWEGVGVHRENGPAFCEWYKSGRIKREEWYINSEHHRVDGPAVLKQYRSGKIKCKEYYIRGLRHNTRGPAYCKWYETGRLKEQKYFLKNEELTIDQWRDRTKPAGILQAISLLPYPIAVEVTHHYCKA
jgi:antitoxin component YwqK of YwqJK toxin-antitoxin module